MGKLLKTVLTIFIACALVSSPVMAETEQPGYTLDGVTVLSRHNIRSPLSGSGSLIGDITPHEWFKWTSNPSELSLRGAILETLMETTARRKMRSVFIPIRSSAHWLPPATSLQAFFRWPMCRLSTMGSTIPWIRHSVPI